MLALIVIAAFMLLMPAEIMSCAKETCALFAGSVLPGLFPFLTITLLVTSRLPKNVQVVPIVLMGLLSGSPSGARLLSYATLSKKAYRAAAHLTAVMSPMFILGTLPAWLNGHGAALFIAGTLSAVLTCGLSFLLPMKNGGETLSGGGIKAAPLTLAEAVNHAAQTMLTVCGCMVMGSCLSLIVQKILPIGTPLASALLQGALEVTKGAKDISNLVFWDVRLAPALVAMLISFNGAALMMQNHAFYQKGTLPLLPYIFLKLVHAALAFVICFLLIPVFPAPSLQASAITFPATSAPLLVWGFSFLLSEIVLQWGERRKRRLTHASHSKPESPARR